MQDVRDSKYTLEAAVSGTVRLQGPSKNLGRDLKDPQTTIVNVRTTE